MERARTAPIDAPAAGTCVRTLRLKVRPESRSWLNAAAIEVNQVWNWANELSAKAARPFSGKPKWLSGFDLCNLSSGATEFMNHIGADTIQRICTEYATKRRCAKRLKLRWRVSRGAKRSLGWVPFKGANPKRKGHSLRFCRKCFRVFDREYLADHRFRDGCFAQDALGDWWLCVSVQIPVEASVAPGSQWASIWALRPSPPPAMGLRLQRVDGRTPMRTGLLGPSVPAIRGRPSASTEKRPAAAPMRCISFRGRSSISIRTS